MARSLLGLCPLATNQRYCTAVRAVSEELSCRTGLPFRSVFVRSAVQLTRGGAGGRDELGEQSPHGVVGVGQLLGVPLDADQEHAVAVLDALDQPVGGEGGGGQAGGQALD